MIPSDKTGIYSLCLTFFNVLIIQTGNLNEFTNRPSAVESIYLPKHFTESFKNCPQKR